MLVTPFGYLALSSFVRKYVTNAFHDYHHSQENENQNKVNYHVFNTEHRLKQFSSPNSIEQAVNFGLSKGPFP